MGRKKIVTTELEDFDVVKELVVDHINLIEVDKNAFNDAEVRAGKFLMVQAILNDFRLDIDEKLAQQKALMTTRFAIALNEAAGSNAQARDANAKGDEEYLLVQEFHDDLKAAQRWTDTNLGIFTNAHVLFRQMAQKE